MTNYLINWTDDTLKSPFTLNSSTQDTSTTSLTLNGKDVSLWGEKVNENFLRLLENFASNGTPPANPTIGQTWFNYSTSVLKVYYADAWHDLAYAAAPFTMPDYFVMQEQGSAPGTIVNKGTIYTKDVSTITELFYVDSNGAEVQITGNGALKVSTLPANYITGFKIANNGGSPNDRIDFAAGRARDSTDTLDITTVTGLTKRLDVAWAAGAAAGGLFSGTKTLNTWYHCFAIRKDADGTIDFGFDTSVTAANKPVGYTYYVWLGAILTDASSNIRGFKQYGRRFQFNALVDNGTITIDNSASTLVTISAPPGKICDVKVRWGGIGSVGGGYWGAIIVLQSPDMTSQVVTAGWTFPVTTSGSGSIHNNSAAAVSQRENVITNSSSQISARSYASESFGFATEGWTVLE